MENIEIEAEDVNAAVKAIKVRKADRVQME